MKKAKRFLVCAAIAVLSAALPFTAGAASQERSFDLNGDGVSDISDVTYLQMYLAGYEDVEISDIAGDGATADEATADEATADEATADEATADEATADEEYYSIADFNRDGIIDINDATAMQKYLAGYGLPDSSADEATADTASADEAE